MGIRPRPSTSRKGDNNRLSVAGFVEINPSLAKFSKDQVAFLSAALVQVQRVREGVG